MPVWIEDGYTAEETIPAAPGHPAVPVAYRPALYERRVKYLRAVAGPDAKAEAEEALALLEGHVASLDGEAGPIPRERLRRLHPELTRKLLDRVLGYAAEEAEADRKN